MQQHYDILEQDVPLAERDCDLLNANSTNQKRSAGFQGNSSDRFVWIDEEGHHQTALLLCRVNLAIWDFVAPGYLLVGTIGNILALLIWMRPEQRRQSNGMSFTLMVLACCDIIVLCSGFLRHYVRKTSYINQDIQTASAVLCKLTEFVVYYSLCYSSWLVSAISVERCLTIVYYDQRGRHGLCCGRRRSTHAARSSARRPAGTLAQQRFDCCVFRKLRSIRMKMRSVEFALFMLAVACSLVYGHILWTRVYSKSERTCKNMSAGMQHFMQNIWPYVDMTFAVLLPHTVTILASSIIIVHLRCVHRRKLHTVPALAVSCAPASAHSLGSQSFVARHSLRIAVTLVCICVFYVLCQLPAKLWLILVPVSARRSDHVHQHFFNRLTWTMLIMVQYTAHTSNFVIYSLSNKKFRAGLLALFCAKKRRVTRSLRTVRNNTFASPGGLLPLTASTPVRRQSAPAWLAPFPVRQSASDILLTAD